MSDEIQQLIRLVAPPADPVGNHDPKYWDQLQQKIGTKLPREFLELIHIYGCGNFGEFNFHTDSAILENTSPEYIAHYNGNLTDQSWRSTIKQSNDDGDEITLYIWPVTPGLFLIGGNASNQWLGYYTKGDPDDWTIIVSGNSLCKFINTHMKLAPYLLKCHTNPDELSILMYNPNYAERKNIFQASR
jgi:hypothetical protein